jgi:hypothetical protein
MIGGATGNHLLHRPQQTAFFILFALFFYIIWCSN